MSSLETQIESPSVAVGRVETKLDSAGTCAVTLERLLRQLGWGDAGSPLGNVISKSDRVVIKPNFVTDRNRGPWGIEPLVTSAELVRNVTEFALRQSPSRVVVADAPIQSCDFGNLLKLTGLAEWSADLQARDARYCGIADLRRTTCDIFNGVRVKSEENQPLQDYVLFDLGVDSLLEPVSDDRNSFRVTRYSPAAMFQTHRRGRHQYLIAKEVLDANVIINLPKLKTHKKAGVTCALKNLVGINGNKEFLPHHRVGGSHNGGDCYPGRNSLKRVLELVLDRENSSDSIARARRWHMLSANLERLLRRSGDQLGVEGAWIGNDTVWRMSLDLNRILLYGRADGKLSDSIQRRVIHLVDAMIGGQGDGPLAPQPLYMGLLLAGENAAAIDWVGAALLGYVPAMIPIVREAFAQTRWPLTKFGPEDVRIVGDLGSGIASDLVKPSGPVVHPVGWVSAGSQSTQTVSH
jgi:uncharacterized protein (DUF362 family)